MLLLELRGAVDILPKMLASHIGQIHQQDKITINQGILDRGISTEVNTIGHLVGINTSKMDHGHLVGINTSKMDLIITKDLLRKTEIRLRLVQILSRDNVHLLLKGFVVRVVGITTVRQGDHHGKDFLGHLLQANSITKTIEVVPNKMLPVQGINV